MKLLQLAVGAYLVAAPVAGQVITPFTQRPPQSQEFLDYGWGSGTYAPYAWEEVGPYVARFMTPGYPTTPTFSVICVDYSNSVADEWVNVSALGGGAGLVSNTRLGSGGYFQYQASAYLASLFDSWQDYVGAAYNGGTFADRTQVFSGIHAAIWTIMTAGTGNDFPFFSSNPDVYPNPQLAADMAEPFINMAVQNGASYDASGWYVLSSTAIDGATVEERLRDGGQEFLMRTNVVPEPSTVILLATGLLLVGIFGRRRSPRNELA